MATEGFYAAVLLDFHFGTLVMTQEALSLVKTANEARRGYLKYLFHEVRTPMNSLSLTEANAPKTSLLLRSGILFVLLHVWLHVAYSFRNHSEIQNPTVIIT
mmetsp:Transcript_25417/g.36490  ORF Transcript_25417/g.36490 Transcript_25417/m.36490 type:complete len:102 (+) Transcript_25417:784-1089(+)